MARHLVRDGHRLDSFCQHGMTGGDEKGDDVAVLMTATWKSVHQSVLANKPLKEFKLRQYLFSAKARLLYRLNRPTEVVDRGLKFIQDFSKLISERELEIGLHPYFREVPTSNPSAA